eukprot:scaffold14699_cov170-Amphora_coffeaeformis.AAC.19
MACQTRGCGMIECLSLRLSDDAFLCAAHSRDGHRRLSAGRGAGSWCGSCTPITANVAVLLSSSGVRRMS